MNTISRTWLILSRVFILSALAAFAINLRAETAPLPLVGEAVFVAGEVWVSTGNEKKPLITGAQLSEGISLQTGQSGYAYMRMNDGGFFILRPNSRAKIVNYLTDLTNPSNIKLRLDLESGQVRAISGEAAHKSPNNFRLNTPIAAIGVRGTDFNVSTTADTTRVTVNDGAVIVDKLGNGCFSEAFGTCQSNYSQVLRSTDKEILEVYRNEPSLRRTPLEDSKTPAPSASKVNTSTYANANSETFTERLNQSSKTPLFTSGTVAQNPELIYWGRWRTVESLGANNNVSDGLKNNEGFSDGLLFSLWRESGSAPTLPKNGQWNFQLNGYESYFLVGKYGEWTVLPTKIKDASLSVDLVQRSFSTKLTTFNENASANLFAIGSVDANGQFLWAYPGSNMSVRGVLAGKDGNQAGYIFNTQLAPTIWATGAISWKRP